MENLDLKFLQGIKNGKRAFRGPKIVQLDLTGRCNNQCIGCWVHSLHIKVPPRDKNAILPFQKAQALIHELASAGTEEIIISGAGEPFLHPHAMEIIELIKSKGIKLNVITNFSLLNEEKLNRLIKSNVDLLTVSIWAGTGETYAKTHPHKTANDFLQIKKNLKKLSELKSSRRKYRPQVKVYNVLCNQNFKEINQMVDFCIEAEVEGVEFQLMDTVKGSTDFLALSPEQIKEIKKQFHELTHDNRLYFKELSLGNISDLGLGNANEQKELIEFPGRFIKIPDGFQIKEYPGVPGKKEIFTRRLVCPAGFTHIPHADNPLIEEYRCQVKFTMPLANCRQCALWGSKCSANKKGEIYFKFLKILGFYILMRRLNSAYQANQEYESDMIDNIPCYIGWEYLRVLSTGEVIPCCKSVNHPLGDINQKNFGEIWNSRAYQQFRNNAKNLKKRDRYFEKINCVKSCDNLGMNFSIHRALQKKNKKNDFSRSLDRKIHANIKNAIPEAKTKIFFSASKFRRGNLCTASKNFGDGMVIDGGQDFGLAEYKVNFVEPGTYELFSCYASQEERPVELYFDGQLLVKEGLNRTTRGWTKDDLFWFREATLKVSPGEHTLKISSENLMPHLYAFAFLKDVKEARDAIDASRFEKLYPGPNALGLFKDKFKNTGIFAAVRDLFTYITKGKLADNYLDILGIYTGDYAFKGPNHVQIDLTNNCNNDCIACWCNSPLLEETTLSPELKKQQLPFELVTRILDELSDMGTKEIYFSGGGEPFMHPQIMEILEYAKKKGFVCYVNTNFTLLDNEKITKLIELGVEHLTVSTWAATPETYVATHPNKNKATFETIRNNLRFLNATKIKMPYIKLYNVISSRNYFELKDMVLFAKETGCESVEFTLVDTIPGKTDKLLLNADQSDALQNSAAEIAKALDEEHRFNGVILFGYQSFLRRISSASDLAKATYDRSIIDKMPCYIGWNFSRVMPNGDINGCLKAHRIPTGNLYKESFKKIWNGEAQRHFRKKTLVREKKDPFFTLIGNDPDTKEAGCYKSCDDIGRNIHLHNRIMSLTWIEKIALKIIAKLAKRKLFKKKAVSDQVVRGAIEGRRAFIGPEQVVIDVTNRCNEKCVGCWLYSPLLKEPPKKEWFKQELDFHKAKALIHSLRKLGVKEVRLTGGGEPFLYPEIMELIELVKSNNMRCSVTTNFSLLDKEKIRKLIKLGIDELTVSLWASNGAAYQRTHPGTPADWFERINENLRFLMREKNNGLSVVLSNVICKLNYSEIEDMYLYAESLGAEGIYYTLVDALEGTESLLLNEEERRVALQKAETVKGLWLARSEKEKIRLDFFEGFISRLKCEGALTGRYDEKRMENLPCYAGWAFARVMANGDIAPCCRGVKKTMGNINTRSFEEIWFSDRYDEFRQKAKTLPKTDGYFKDIGCLKECDNLMHNEEIHRRILKSCSGPSPIQK